MIETAAQELLETLTSHYGDRVLGVAVMDGCLVVYWSGSYPHLESSYKGFHVTNVETSPESLDA